MNTNICLLDKLIETLPFLTFIFFNKEHKEQYHWKEAQDEYKIIIAQDLDPGDTSMW